MALAGIDVLMIRASYSERPSESRYPEVEKIMGGEASLG